MLGSILYCWFVVSMFSFDIFLPSFAVLHLRFEQITQHRFIEVDITTAEQLFSGQLSHLLGMEYNSLVIPLLIM